MKNAFATLAPIYGNIIDEAKTRLHMIQLALLPETERSIGYIGVSDLCALQFRKTFEAIALGCLVVHGELPNTNRLKSDIYRADKLLSALQKLHPDFYPRPCEIKMVGPGRHWNLRELCDHETWLGKEELRRLYFEFDHEMHVGTLTRRAMNAVVLPKEFLVQTLLRTAKLINSHVINLIDPDVAIVCQAREVGKQPVISRLTLNH